jgi:amino acid transporter
MGEWLNAAGPGGTAVGFAVGALAMTGVALCYGELAARSSAAGGEFLYVLRSFGANPAFIVGWFLSLYGIAVCAFEAIALAWLLRTLVPSLELPALYAVRGVPVTLDGLLIGLGGALLVGVLHARGPLAAIRFQKTGTYGFIIISVLLIICGVVFGHFDNTQPLFPNDPQRSWLNGTAWIFSACAFFLNGWQASIHAIEERTADTSITRAVGAMVVAIWVAAAFYVAMVLAASSATPWMGLVARDLPAVVAFRSLTTNGILGTVVLVAAIVSLAKTWTAIAWIASRLLLAQARCGFFPRALASVHPVTGAPRMAIAAVTGLSLAGIALGNGAIVPLVNMVATCLALSMAVCMLALLLYRGGSNVRPSFVVPGGRITVLASLVAAVLMIGMAVLEPWIAGHGKVPLEWILLLGWAAIGLTVWARMRRLRALGG